MNHLCTLQVHSQCRLWSVISSSYCITENEVIICWMQNTTCSSNHAEHAIHCVTVTLHVIVFRVIEHFGTNLVKALSKLSCIRVGSNRETGYDYAPSASVKWSAISWVTKPDCYMVVTVINNTYIHIHIFANERIPNSSILRRPDNN